MIIKKISPPCLSWILVTTACLLVNASITVIAVAEPTGDKDDVLQRYRNEIEKTETTAAQSVIDQLGSSNVSNSADSNHSDQDTRYNPVPPSSSNSDKAFSSPPSAQGQKNTNPTTPSSSTSNNPWLKPNPWEAPSKQNPWAHAPIPGPTAPGAGPPSTSNGMSVRMSPPNIFALPQTTADKDKKNKDDKDKVTNNTNTSN